MTLVRFGQPGMERPGLIDDQGQIRDLSGFVEDITPSQLSDESLQRIASIPLDQLPAVRGEQRLAAPVNGVRKIIAIGFNYIDHAAEMAVEVPTEPLVFMKAITALANPSDPIISPRSATKLDYESELVVVIGKKAKYVSVEEALDHVAGYTTGNDVSERAFQRERGGQFVKGKSADSFAPFGPHLVSRDSIDDIQNLQIWSEVNGQIRQNGNTNQMVFGVAEIVSYLSQFMTLEPGDLIYTGTPEGVGDGMNPPQYLQPGDSVRVGIDGLGEIQQRVVASE
ncbi:fumarylacetoacetate hydrolase family protein [Pseudohongiella spirulinae]|uniref:fumarylacetoacetate hydrolase family protein n=1 Tax=Pseudohongiella spirulinae TaxID=1249552 RepID=UPI00071785C1|nr:fumarylacetoacetate hydrolase family protein [Pseudohongiella spirulinae]